MTLAQLRTQARRLTKTTSGNYPDEQLDIDINQAYAEIWMMILEAEGYKNTGGDFKYYDLISTVGLAPITNVAPIGYNGEYPFPSIAIDIDGIEISYDGTSYKKAEVIDKSDSLSSVFNEQDYDGTFSEQNPKAFIYRDSIFVRPTKDTVGNITNGFKLTVRQRQDSLIADIDIPLFEPNFHSLIPLKVAQDYFMYYPEKYNPKIDQKAQIIEAQLISLYQDRTPINLQIKSHPKDRGLKGW
jgi:hypothetical protein